MAGNYADSSRHGLTVRKPNGFTIVELLIVIIVIGVLAGITVVAFNGVKTKAVNSEKAEKAQRVKKALEMYAIEYGGYPRNDQMGGAAGIGPTAAALLKLNQSDLEPSSFNRPGWGVDVRGIASSTSTGLTYISTQYANDIGFACENDITPNNCKSFRLSYWDYTTNQVVIIRGSL